MLKVPKRDRIPAWYEIGVGGPGVLIIRIHEAAMRMLRGIDYDKAPGIIFLGRSFDLDPFVAPRACCYGFGGVLTLKRVDGLWCEWWCKLPVLRHRQKKKNDTPLCRIRNVRATLQMLFILLWLFDGDTKWSRPQLVVMDTLELGGHNEAGLSATLTPTLVRWLREKGDAHSDRIVQAMMATDHYLWQGPTSPFDKYRFKTVLTSGDGLHLEVPGNASGLDPESNRSPGSGYQLSPHNIDGPLQQLDLLMGLAKIHDLAREDGC